MKLFYFFNFYVSSGFKQPYQTGESIAGYWMMYPLQVLLLGGNLLLQLKASNAIRKRKRNMCEVSDETILFPLDDENLLCKLYLLFPIPIVLNMPYHVVKIVSPSMASGTEDIDEIHTNPFTVLHDESLHNVQDLLLHCSSTDDMPLFSRDIFYYSSYFYGMFYMTSLCT